MSDVVVTQHVNAPAARLYDLVSDLPRMGEWSPENTGGSWTGGATGPAVGAKFRGTNRSGWRRWSTLVHVTAADPGRRFGFDVSAGGIPIAAWEYTFADTADGGCDVTERWIDRRPGLARKLSDVVMQTPDRGVHNRRTMEETLRKLKAAAESTP